MLLQQSHGKPPKKKIPSSTFFSWDEKPTAGAGVATAVIARAGIAAAGQVLLLLLVWASQELKEVVVHQSGHNPSERAFAG